MIRPLRQELSSGDQVGRYRLIAELARGGMGIVYLASTQGPAGFNKLVALKQLRPDLVEDSSFLTMFLDEARVAARLSHPNIVQTNDVEHSDGRYFIAMEYLDGRSFSQIMKRFASRSGFPIHMSLSVLRDVLNALDYAHSFEIDGASFGVIHRDISPQNIFVTFNGCAKVIDFGIAKAHDSVIETKTGVLKGKVHYMAPEQLCQRADPRSDLFSTGAVLFEVITGHRLWAGLNEVEVMGRLARGDIPPVETTLPNVPPALLRICRTALSPRIEDRHASAAKMRDAIDEYLWSARITPEGREVGAQLVEAFGAEREATRIAIDGYLAAVRDGEAGPLRPLQPLGSVETSHGRPRPSSTRSVVESAVVQPSSSVVIATGARSFARGKLVAVATLAVLAAGILIGLGYHGDTPIALPAPALATPSEGRSLAPIPLSMIAFSVTVSPSSARVLIDGEPMPSNPFIGRFPKDFAMHRVRASAPGYVAKERAVSFADNVMVDLSLDPRAPVVSALPARRHETWTKKVTSSAPEPPSVAHPAIATTPAPPVRASAPSDITRRSSDPPLRRAIDSSNPYGEDL